MLINYVRVCNLYSGFFALTRETNAIECAEKALFSGLSRHVSLYGLSIKDGWKIEFTAINGLAYTTGNLPLQDHM